jgi:hypothetical protein
MSQHNPISTYDRFILADCIVEAKHDGNPVVLDNYIREFRGALGLDPVEYPNERILIIASNIIAMGG